MVIFLGLSWALLGHRNKSPTFILVQNAEVARGRGGWSGTGFHIQPSQEVTSLPSWGAESY